MAENILSLIKRSIITIFDHPVEGVKFRDITNLIENGDLFAATIDLLIARYKDMGIDKIAATEARGFIFGAPLAVGIGAGLVLIRKANKLPRDTIRVSYGLEYGTDVLEIHKTAIKEGERVLLIDDLLATGGTSEASIKLIHRSGGIVVEAAFVVALPYLNGVQKINDQKVNSFWLIEFDKE